MKFRTRVIVIGEAGTLRERLVEQLRANRFIVDCLDASAEPARIADRPLLDGVAQRVIFTPVEGNEFRLLERDLESQGEELLQAVSAGAKTFLAQAQAALKLLMQAQGGQLWVCDYDDSFAYHLETPSSPILAQARAGAVRSLAKEYSRMNIAINSLFAQPIADDTTRPLFRQAAPALKSYAMRYKPNTADDIVEFLLPFLTKESLAFSGALVSTGTGICQGHLVA